MGAWDLKSRDLRRVGRVADRENCAWASVIFERSGSTRVKKETTFTLSEGSTILGGLIKLRMINQRWQIGLKSTICGGACVMPCL